MEKRLLMAVDEDSTSSLGIRFIGEYFDDLASFCLTLLHVMPCHADMYHEGNAAKSKAQALLQKAYGCAVSCGFYDRNILLQPLPCRYGVLRDIIETAHRGMYDAVVIGSRFLSRIERLYEQSVGKGLLSEDMAPPLWVCRSFEKTRGNVLLCLDGGEPAYRMADHVGFMLRNSPRHSITILHCGPQGAEAEQIIRKGREKLLVNGVAAERIVPRILDCRDYAGQILRIAEDEGYAVVAMGHDRRVPVSFLDRVFARSSGLYLKDNIQQCSLWVGQ